jgi:hypothetical protein
MFSIPMSVATVHGESGMLWDWMTTNYDAILEKIPEMFMIYMPYFAQGCSRERLVAAEAFFADPEHHVTGQEKEMAKVAEGVNDCASLRDREGEAVAAYLREFEPVGESASMR